MQPAPKPAFEPVAYFVLKGNMNPSQKKEEVGIWVLLPLAGFRFSFGFSRIPILFVVLVLGEPVLRSYVARNVTCGAYTRVSDVHAFSVVLKRYCTFCALCVSMTLYISLRAGLCVSI